LLFNQTSVRRVRERRWGAAVSERRRLALRGRNGSLQNRLTDDRCYSSNRAWTTRPPPRPLPLRARQHERVTFLAPTRRSSDPRAHWRRRSFPLVRDTPPLPGHVIDRCLLLIRPACASSHCTPRAPCGITAHHLTACVTRFPFSGSNRSHRFLWHPLTNRSFVLLSRPVPSSSLAPPRSDSNDHQ
jgi:hypothetical protein